MTTITTRNVQRVACLALHIISGPCLAADTDCVMQDSAIVGAGRLVAHECLAGGSSVSVWSLGGKEIIRGPYPIILKSRNPQANTVVFQGARMKETGCSAEAYLVDLSEADPKIFRFGVLAACNEFDWASWGAKSSVIALKKNVRFVYKAGRLMPPRKDNALFSSIKPSMFDTPVESLEPFAVEVIAR